MIPVQDLKNDSITKLGVFDSGLGGLTVLQRLLEIHPGHDYIYFGDTAHVPYGSRTADDVVSLVSEIARYLVAQGCHGLILACNTSSALALSALRATVNVPMVGVIGTASREVARHGGSRVAVLANPLTAASGVYKTQILNEAKLLGREDLPEVIEIGCPDLVPIVENDLLHSEESYQILASYAKTLTDLGTDTLVLGCTHYPLLLPVLEPMLGESVRIVNPADLIPSYLHPRQGPKGKVEFKVSGPSESFDLAAAKILGREVHSERVTLSRSCEAV